MQPVDPVSYFTVRYGEEGWEGRLLSTFLEYGVCVVEGVYSDEECDVAADETIGYIERMGTGVDRRDSGTWKRENLPAQTRPGLFQTVFSNLPTVWKARTNPKIHHLYSVLYSHIRGRYIPYFISSIDGVNIKHNESGPFHDYNNDDDWPHIDQTGGGLLDCIQGQLVLTNTTACFRCSPKSYKVFNEILQVTNTTSSDHWCKFDTTNIQMINQIRYLVESVGGMYQIPILSKKGSFIVWASTTIHSARHSLGPIRSGWDQPPLTGTQWDGWRIVIYVCLRPHEEFFTKQKKPNAAIMKRNNLVITNRCTNHTGERTFPKLPGGRWASARKYHPIIEYLHNNPDYIYQLLNIPNPWAYPDVKKINGWMD